MGDTDGGERSQGNSNVKAITRSLGRGLALLCLSLVANVAQAGDATTPAAPPAPVTALPAGHELNPTDIESFFDGLVPLQIESNDIAGATIAIVKDGKLIFAKGYGFADMKTRAPVSPETTLFRVGSVTKLFTWTSVMQLVEQGKLDLDRPLSEYLDKPYLPDEPRHLKITARMVLSHTTGFPNWRKDGLRSGNRLTMLFEPGTRFDYSGEGFTYLQRVIEHITGEPFERYVKRALFEPLGITTASYVWEDGFEKLAAASRPDSGETPPNHSLYRNANVAYSRYCSPMEYALFLVEILKQDRSAAHSLSARSIDAMPTRATKTEGLQPVVRRGGQRPESVYYGLGWIIDATPSGDRIHHGGSNGAKGTGFRCYCEFDPKAGSGIVVMTNAAGGRELWQELIAKVSEP